MDQYDTVIPKQRRRPLAKVFNSAITVPVKLNKLNRVNFELFIFVVIIAFTKHFSLVEYLYIHIFVYIKLEVVNQSIRNC